MNDGVVIRDFVVADQRRVRDLILAGLAEHWGHIDESLNTDLDDIASAYAHGRTIVAQAGGGLVGTGTLRPLDDQTSEIVRMSVPAAHRRAGIGRRIVDELISTARRWECKCVVLETSSAWADVIAFYVGCGFGVTHVAEGEFGEGTWFEFRL